MENLPSDTGPPPHYIPFYFLTLRQTVPKNIPVDIHCLRLQRRNVMGILSRVSLFWQGEARGVTDRPEGWQEMASALCGDLRRVRKWRAQRGGQKTELTSEITWRPTDNNWRSRGAQDEIDGERNYEETNRQQLAHTRCTGRNRNQTSFRWWRMCDLCGSNMRQVIGDSVLETVLSFIA